MNVFVLAYSEAPERTGVEVIPAVETFAVNPLWRCGLLTTGHLEQAFPGEGRRGGKAGGFQNRGRDAQQANRFVHSGDVAVPARGPMKEQRSRQSALVNEKTVGVLRMISQTLAVV